jgi:AmmeMemoRadiSam system protein B
MCATPWWRPALSARGAPDHSAKICHSMLRAAHADSWYPTGPALASMLADAASRVQAAPSAGLVRAIVVPHAGYRYCVQTSMHAFAQLRPELYDRVFVLGPSHSTPIACCTIADATSAESPLGPIPFDTDAVAALLAEHPKLFEKLDRRTAEIEHSLEMEFPLLKFVFQAAPFKIVPIMVGSIGPAKCCEVAAALKKFAEPRTLFVISSDFCHWGDRFRYTYLPEVPGEVWQKIERLDRWATERISTGDPAEFACYLDETRNTICGRHPILIMMHLFPGSRIEWPHYSQSSNITSRHDSSVSYMAGVLRTD